ncbi:MAG: hypothetical protein WCP96_08615 [Methylococcaceae bacterium]
MSAAKIQLTVSPIGDKQIPESQLRPLTQVPDDIKKQISAGGRYRRIVGALIDATS